MSALESEMEMVLKALKIPFQREYRFKGLCGTRRWRFDFVIGEPLVGLPIAVEVEGGIWTNGRHSRGGNAFAADCEKYTQAAICAWTVLRYCSHQISTTAPDELALMWEIYQADLSQHQTDKQPQEKQTRARDVRQPRRSMHKKV